MKWKEKQALKKHQSTRRLMGITEVKDHCVVTPHGRLYFFLLRPFNLSVESEEDILGHVIALQNLLRGTDALEILAMDSCQSFQDNQQWYRERLDAEKSPAVQELLRRDETHLNDIRVTTASDREFALVYRQRSEQTPLSLSQLELTIREQGFHVRQAKDQDLKRLLAIYYEQNTSEHYENFDGEKYVVYEKA